MRGFRKAPPLLAGMVVLGLTAACGSTVPLAQQRAAESAGVAEANGGLGGTGAAGGAAAGTGAVGAPGGAASTGSSGQPIGGAAPAAAGGPSAGSGSPASSGATGSLSGSTASNAGNGPGVTPTTIYVAGAYDPDASSADAALGAANANPGDTKAETEAMVNWINAHGGVDGRKVSIVWYQASVQNDSTTTDEQGCQTWTQDHKVFILGAGTPILDQCTANEHAVALDFGAITEETTQMDARYPADIDVTGPTIDHSMEITINGLQKQGYFSKGAKLGIVTWDDPYYHYGVAAGADPALSRIGISPSSVAVEYITPPASYGDLGATSSSVQSAVLKFRTAGIDHVLLFDGPSGVNSSGVLFLEWMQQANSQLYYPRYGLNSTSGFSALASDVPSKELVNSIGVGWEPLLDETSTDYPKSKLDPQGQLCMQIMAAAGQSESSNNAVAIQTAICDEFFFMQKALAGVKPLNQRTAVDAIDAIGNYTPIETFGVHVSASQHDGLELVRNTSFYSSCDCYRYTSGSYNAYG
jgi:hypothetical protein